MLLVSCLLFFQFPVCSISKMSFKLTSVVLLLSLAFLLAPAKHLKNTKPRYKVKYSKTSAFNLTIRILKTKDDERMLYFNCAPIFSALTRG